MDLGGVLHTIISNCLRSYLLHLKNIDLIIFVLDVLQRHGVRRTDPRPQDCSQQHEPTAHSRTGQALISFVSPLLYIFSVC